MTPVIDITAEQREKILSLLARHLPETTAWAYGSRVKQKSHPTSDLDLVVFATPEQRRQVGDLWEAFEESDLPFRVDLFVWDEIPEGFRKRIEAEHVVLVEGIFISTEWPLVEIGKIAEIVGGSTPSTKDVRNFDGDIPWLTPKDLSGIHDRVVFRGRRNLSSIGLSSCSARLLPPRAILLSNRAPIGYVAIAGTEIATNQGFRSLILKKDICPEFIYYWLKHNTDELERHATGTTFRELSGSALKRIRIPLPTPSEQHAIARVLSALDDKIELNRRMNQTLEAITRAIFKDFFVDFGPVRANAAGHAPYLPESFWSLFPDRLSDSKIGPIPAGWELSIIGEEVNVVGGSTPSTKNPIYWHNGKHLWATPKDLSRISSPVLQDTEKKITDAGIKKISSGLLPIGTVLLSSRAPIGYLAISEELTAINQGFIAMICKKRLPNIHVLFWCYENLAYIKNISGGSTFSEISKGVFRTIPVVIPSDNILTAYEDIVRPLYNRIAINMKKIVWLTHTRNFILPKLLSREIHLRDAEWMIETAA